MFKMLLLFLVGGVLGFLFDSFHTHSGTTFYPHVYWMKADWWVAPLFGLATVSIAKSSLWFEEQYLRNMRATSWGEILASLVLFGLQYFASGYLSASTLQIYLFLYGFAFAIWLMLDSTPEGLLWAFATAITGCFVEILLTLLGLFHYTNPDLWGIPLWLPSLYLSATFVVANLARHILSR